ncbi:MAG: replication initiator protein [Microvirus sp.]|nr:MAG: replication initiator protein [Microvirus sp.]
MPCYHPIDAYRQEGGGKLIFGSPRGQLEAGQLSLPCGQCIGCRLDRSVDWVIRIMHERALHEYAWFVTLTYSDEFVPYGGTLHYRHFQLFMKRLRARCGPTRFFMCGEYGDTTFRPHYHAALFGPDFPDKYKWRKSAAGFQLFRSPLLESLWDLGSSEIGNLSFESAAYVARYCMKKITGDGADAHYEQLVPDTGEVVRRDSEFAKMSLRPGIGALWFDKFFREVLVHDGVYLGAVKLPVPRYYVDRLPEEDRVDLLYKRYLRSTGSVDGSYDRLRVREIVTRARLSFKSRSLE